VHPFAITDQNPNDLYGVPGCSFAGQQPSADCAGQWFVVPTQHVRVANNLAPHICVCGYHLNEALKATGFKTPVVREQPPRPAKRARRDVEEVSL
jgi:cellulase/cellobiase CelA1